MNEKQTDLSAVQDRAADRRYHPQRFSVTLSAAKGLPTQLQTRLLIAAAAAALPVTLSAAKGPSTTPSNPTVTP